MPVINSSSVPSSLAELISSISIHVTGRSQFGRFQRMYENDRIAFIYDCMPAYRESLTEYQCEVFGYYDEGRSRVSVRGPHGLGKTFMAAGLIHHTVLTAQSDAKVPTTASSWRQLEKYLWPEVHKHAKEINWTIVGRDPYDRNELHGLSIKLNDGTVEAFAMSSDDHATIEGAHATILFYIFDEAKTIPRATWNAAEGAFSTEGLSVDHHAMALAISTPGDPSGQFYDMHAGTPGFEDWIVRHVTLEECIRAKRVSKVWAVQRKAQWGETSALYQNRVLGEFAEISDDGVIPLAHVNMAMDRFRAWDAAGRPPLPQTMGRKTLGVDVARSGEDETVMAVREALTLLDFHSYAKIPVTQAAAHASVHGRNRFIHIETDGGLGASVYDIMRNNRVPNLRPITVNGATSFIDKSAQYKFLNVRAAMWWHMRELLDPVYGYDIMLVPNEKLKKDLATPKYDLKKDGVVVLESKKSIRARIGRSTDYGDACCLAFWMSSSGGGVVV